MLQLAIIVLYFAAVIIIAVTTNRRFLRFDEFIVAGHKYTTFFVSGSLLATVIGGSATIGLSGLGYSRGLSAAWWLLVGTIGLIALGFFFAAKVRNYGLYTLPQLIEKQYNRPVSLAASILIVIAWLGVTAAQIIAAGKILSAMGFGSAELWMIIFTIIFVGYAMTGGQYAIIRTDILDMALIFIGIFAVLGVLLWKLGGLDGLFSALPPDKLSFPLSESFKLSDLFSYLLIIGLTYVVGPDMYSRLFCARDGKTARRSALWVAIFTLPLAFCITIIGMGAYVLYPDISSEQAFPMLLTGILPTAVSGIVLAGLVSAIMSSAVATLWSSGTILSVNIIGYFSKNESDRKSVTTSRWSLLFIGIAALGLALLIKGVISSILFAYTIYTCGIIIPVLFGFFKDKIKVTPAGAMAAIIGGGAAGLVYKITAIKYLDICGLAISLILLLSVSFIDRKIKNRRSNI